ncbi:hypothetical protein SEA_BUMBLE_48 [Arthrobacter phage Bumble]|uniref:Uncharacterized protein n=1 Tax=Arthrobacter phage Bumble TaxID=2743904 RepID=A0A7G3VA14_9CAUD|nr:hypothetical protein SEA_BUMBLE_48 [Arthrobacter phage Bumble]
MASSPGPRPTDQTKTKDISPMLNFIPVRIPGLITPLSATSETTGLRYLLWNERLDGAWKLRIDDLEDAPAADRDKLALTFNSDEEAVEYADRFDFNQSIAERLSLPCTLKIEATAGGPEGAVERYYPDHANAYASARRIVETEYRAWLPPRRATWWSNRAVRLLKAYGRVETPDVVVTLEVPAAVGEASDA